MDSWTERRNIPDEYNVVPGALVTSLEAYVDHGRPVGDFLYGVLTDSLTGAMYHADLRSREHLHTIWKLVYNKVPFSAWGSEEVVDQWIDDGGFEGRHRSDDAA